MAQSPSIKREKWVRLSLSWLVIVLVVDDYHLSAGVDGRGVIQRR